MKKFFYLFLILCLGAAVMTSCSEKNTPSGETEKPDDKEKTDGVPDAALLEFTFNANEDMFKVFAISLDYYDTNGKIQNHELKDTAACSLYVISTGLPATLGYRINFTRRPNVDLSQFTQFRVLYKYKHRSCAIDANDEPVGPDQARSIRTEELMDPEQIDAWLEKYNAKPVAYRYEFDKDGKCTVKNWAD